MQQAFISGLGIQSADWETLTYRGIREWDSVAHMQLIAEIEEKFGLLLETNDVIGMSSYAKAREILQRYGVVFHE